MKPLKDSTYKLIFGMILLLMISCNFETKYNKEAWQSSDSGFPSEYRNNMLKDLTEHHQLKGATVRGILKLLGRPDQLENNLIIYNIVIKYDGDTDVTYSKKLKLSFAKDSVVHSFAIVEWHKD
jgi:hypothetical protein